MTSSSSHSLSRSPLQEAIFELSWGLEEGKDGLTHDAGYEFALGIFKNKLKAEFPHHEAIHSDERFLIQFLGLPSHQFWKSEKTWPVIQFGQGIFTVNDIGGDYVWDGRFHESIKIALKHWKTSYDTPKKVVSLRLQYLNNADIGESSPESFVSNQLQTRIENGFSRPAEMNKFSISQSFELKDNSALHLMISNSKNNTTGKNSVFWRIVVEKHGTDIPLAQIPKWVEFAHNEISTFFKNLLDSAYYASLS